MLEISELRAFVAVVRSGGFTAAAAQLGQDKAHISRVVTRLEERLSAQLLRRSTRSLAVTEIGQAVYQRAISILEAVEETEAAAANAQGAPRGLLRLTCGEEFGQLVVSRWIVDCLIAWPEMRIDAEFTNRVVDVVHEGFDLAIRVGALPDSALVARKLGEVDYALYASPAYLSGRGALEWPEALEHHDILRLSIAPAAPLRLEKEGAVVAIARPPRLVVNNNDMLRKACLAGLGIVLLPRFQAASAVSQGELLELLPGWTRKPVPIHALFPSSRFLAPKLKAFVDLALEKCRQGISI